MSLNIFNNESAKLLLALRTRTVDGIKNDFRGIFTENKCPFSCDSTDTLQHLLECSVLRQQHVSDNVLQNNVSYIDVFLCTGC